MRFRWTATVKSWSSETSQGKDGDILGHSPSEQEWQMKVFRNLSKPSWRLLTRRGLASPLQNLKKLQGDLNSNWLSYYFDTKVPWSLKIVYIFPPICAASKAPRTSFLNPNVFNKDRKYTHPISHKNALLWHWMSFVREKPPTIPTIAWTQPLLATTLSHEGSSSTIFVAWSMPLLMSILCQAKAETGESSSSAKR